jgi:glycine betaine catabolism A
MSRLSPSLPSSAYCTPEFFAREKTHIFLRDWSAVCRSEEIATPGDWQVINLAGEDLLLVRGKDGAPHAFYNVCRHRGARLCVGHDEPRRPGRAVLPDAVQANGAIRCPYHGWLYDSAGRLRGTPHMDESDDFRREEFSLYPVGAAEWGGFVFLNPAAEQAAPLAAQLGDVPARVAHYDLAALRIGHRVRYEVEANWKIICENYNECYHCGPVHPELVALVPAFREQGGAGLDWSRGVPHREGATTFSWTGTSKRAPFQELDADERERHKGELLYPTLFLSLASEHVAAFILRPRGPERTDIDCLLLFAADEVASADFMHDDVSGFWDVVNQQDWAICERVQAGMHARPHLHGYYAPMEDFNLDMRRYIAERLGLD